MKKFILTIGLNDKDTKQQRYDTITAYKMVENILQQYTDGYTMYQANGGYKHNDGTFTNENIIKSRVIIC